MLDSLLASLPKLEAIVGYFSADPFMKGCRCYLHSAVKANFKFVQFDTIDEECGAKNEISEDKYKKVCKEYKKCFKYEKLGDGIITKK